MAHLEIGVAGRRAGSRPCRAASCSAWSWPGLWPRRPRSCSSTSRPRRWMWATGSAPSSGWSSCAGPADLTVITVLHDLTLAAQFCDRLALMAGGRMVAVGASRQPCLTEESIRRHYGADVAVMDGPGRLGRGRPDAPSHNPKPKVMTGGKRGS